MADTRKKSRPPAKRGRGTPDPKTKYKDEYAEQAKALCFIGADDAGLAEYFGVSEGTILNWAKAHPKFAEARKEKAHADKRVVSSLYVRAIGQEVEEVTTKTEYVKIGEEMVPKVTKTIKKITVLPDPVSCIFWLKNRDKENWSDKQVIAHENGEELVKMLQEGRERAAKARKEREREQQDQQSSKPARRRARKGAAQAQADDGRL